MAISILSNLAIAGAKDGFLEGMARVDPIWQKHCQILKSNTKTETYVFPGHMPSPRIQLNGRQIQGVSDFTFTVTDDVHELTVKIDRESWEDDQVSGIASRFREIGEVYAAYKDTLLAALMENGDSATLGLAPFDNAAMYGATRTIGDSAAIDNDLTSAAATGTAPTPGEFLIAVNDAKAAMRQFEDDTGRIGFNRVAIQKIRVAVPPEFEAAALEAINASFFVTTGTAGDAAVDNVFKGMYEVDVLDFITAADAIYINLVGAERKSFLMQERMPLDVQIDADPQSIMQNDGVMFYARERFAMTYGDPRRGAQHVFT